MSIKQNTIALNLPKTVSALIVYGRHVVQVMTGNPWFPKPEPKLGTVSADLDTLEDAEATAQGRTKGAAATRDLSRKVVFDDMFGLKGYVQGIANQNPAQAEAIIESAGMSLKKHTSHVRPDLEAHLGKIPGEVILRAKSAGQIAAYEWQISGDGGATWTPLGTTTVANTKAEGLTVGTTYLFRLRVTIKKTTGDWWQPISFFMH
ncbi:MAG: fibronectin type III domain-containing protein [Byssovorax sp.]